MAWSWGLAWHIQLLVCLTCGSHLASGSHERSALTSRSSSSARAAARKSAAVARLRELEQRSGGDVDTATLVASLQEVVEGIDQEQSNARSEMSKRSSQCKSTKKELQDSIDKARRVADRMRSEVSTTSAMAKDLDNEVASLKQQIEESSDELDRLQTKRSELAKTHAADQQRTQHSLQQLERVIEAVRGKAVVRPHRQAAADNSLGDEVSELEQLRSGLLTRHDEEGLDPKQAASAAFLQLRQQQKDGHRGSHRKNPGGTLRDDEEKVVKASEAREQEYNEKSKSLADLEKDEEEHLQKLEQELQSQHTAAADKWQQVAEANRTLSNALRSIQRDQDMLSKVNSKCEKTTAFHTGQIDLRDSQMSMLRAGIKLVENLDSSSYVSKDAKGLADGGSFSFLEVASDVEGPASLSGLESTSSRVASSDGLAASEPVADLSLLSSSEQTGGPFDKVLDMIRVLIQSLKDQANDDANQHQFCMAGYGQLRRQRLAKKASIFVQASEIRWAIAAVARLGDEVDFLTAEVKRLDDIVKNEQKVAQEEVNTINDQINDHKIAKDILSTSVTVLVQLCDLPGPGQAWTFVQAGADSQANASSAAGNRVSVRRAGTCEEASGALQGTLEKIDQQDAAAQAYVTAVTNQATQDAQDASTNYNERSFELAKARSAHTNREADLTKAKEDKKTAEEELLLLEEQKKQLDKDCGPGAKETRAQRIERRQEEIDALKSALSVLNGESLPDASV